MDIREFAWISMDVSLQLSMQMWTSALISKQGYLCKDILQWMSVEYEYPQMNIHVFMDISLQVSMLLWISINFDGYACLDLLWSLDPGPCFHTKYIEAEYFCSPQYLRGRQLEVASLPTQARTSKFVETTLFRFDCPG